MDSYLYYSRTESRIPELKYIPDTQTFHKSQKENDKKDSKVILALIPFHPRFINQAPLFYPRDPAHKQDSCLKSREEKNRPFPGKPVCRRTAPVYRNLGRSRLCLHVAPDNAPARRFYRHYGFEQTGEDPGATGPLLRLERELELP